jgi:hypothetical protein
LDLTFAWQFGLVCAEPSQTSRPNFTILAKVGRSSILDIFFETRRLSRGESSSRVLFARNSHADN